MRMLTSISLLLLTIVSAHAQQKVYRCPPITPQDRSTIVGRMHDAAKQGRFEGCRASDNASFDIDCELSLIFVQGIRNISYAPYLGTPWPLLVSCFPELADIKTINTHARMQKEEANKEQQQEVDIAKQKRAALDNDPKHLLIRTYYDYIQVRKCFDQRNGYLSVNISESEMDKAKRAAKGIEDALLNKNSALDKDAAWKTANSDVDDWMTDSDKLDLTLHRYLNSNMEEDHTDRSRCQNALQTIEGRFAK